ncbi:ABC transporter ATP-binding protein [Nocardioides aurantiacus]|uniref:ABC-2 type transport system ATP-binding protein n=1 Tax=Nocardioides aurantiacus TaxID=86796 RepID=A0A3N2CTR9_9ACTN|nr:ATP-binding cassette domain-containing protein [Nocardioides aurantiacus]ROR90915.1 ABC-2 type transport system ATP-binding protein [Nocardioides aurantiacus]
MGVADDPAVTLYGVTKTFGGRHAVRGVDLQVHRGSVYGLVGPNGAGKTTLLRMMCGLVEPTSGRVEVGGRPVSARRTPAGLGALIETPGFVPHLTGRENLRHLARVRGVDAGSVERSLGQVVLLDRADDRYRTYSLGMKQRLGVAAALLSEPAVLVLDEPSNGLVPTGVEEMTALIGQLGRANVTVVVSSHALADVEECCTHVGIVLGGRLVADGSLADILGPARVRLRASPHGRVARVLGRTHPAVVLKQGRDERGLFVDAADESSAPWLVQSLGEAGVDVWEVGPARRNLRTVYDELRRTLCPTR